MMTGVAIRILRRVQAPPERVFPACTDPMPMGRWFGPERFEVTSMEADLRIGGRFAFRMARPERWRASTR